MFLTGNVKTPRRRKKKHSSYSKNVLCNKFRTWEILTEEIAFYKSKYRIGLVGDFNARTGNLPDFNIDDDGRFVGLPDNYISDIDIISRANSDLIVNEFGKRLIELCCMSGIRIINGRKIGDSMGRKTCHEWNGSSSVDYMLADESLFHLIQSFKIHNTFH